MMLLVGSVFAGTAGLLSAACSDDAVALVDATPDAGPDAPSVGEEPPPTPTDAGADPDARGAFDPADVPVACDASPCATQIVAGSGHFCARMSDTTVRCWGRNDFGVLGNASADAGSDAGSTIRDVGGIEGVAQLGAAGQNTCALLDDGGVRCWGSNQFYQLGVTTNRYGSNPVPRAVPLPSEATRITLGPQQACAVVSSGELWCWGADPYLQLLRKDAEFEADPNRSRLPAKALIEPLALSGLALGNYTSFGLTTSGEVWSWGAVGGADGSVAGRIGSVTPDTTPRKLASLENVTSLAVSPSTYEYPSGVRAHACALANGEVYCWGRSYAGALCTGVPGEERAPAHAPFPPTLKAWPQQLAAGDEITCARMTDGSVHCCGSDDRGRLGTGALVNVSPFFVKAAAFTGRAVQVATTDQAVCALVEDGTVECWGSNEHGELGTLPDDEDHATPVKVAF
ncbi:MAG: hypothetical protein KF850_27475 [Labilithrix sp.]|nr:hypothetical protein [Labilithrix sp.]